MRSLSSRKTKENNLSRSSEKKAPQKLVWYFSVAQNMIFKTSVNSLKDRM